MTIPAELIEILMCPETRQPLRPAPLQLVERLNAEIRAGKLRNRGGTQVEKPIVEALVRDDGRALYVVEDGIPVMLVEESIEIAA